MERDRKVPARWQGNGLRLWRKRSGGGVRKGGCPLSSKVTPLTSVCRLLRCHPPHLDIVPWTFNDTFSALQEVTGSAPPASRAVRKAAGWNCLCNLPGERAPPGWGGRAPAPGLPAPTSCTSERIIMSTFCIYLTKLAPPDRLLTWRPPFILLYFWADERVSSLPPPFQNFPGKTILA